MRCKNCKKEIDEYEIFCDDCKKKLKKSSSKEKVEELESLIEDQVELNKEDDTKELEELSSLSIEESILEDTKEIDNLDLDKEITEQSTLEVPKTREELMKLKNNKSNKKTTIIISLLIFLVIVLVGIVLFLMGKEKDPKPIVEEINYEKIINEYGKSIEIIVREYLIKNDEVPTWKYVSEITDYDKYEVVCNVHNIYKDGDIYLNECKVDDKDIEFSYGKLKEEKKEGKTIQIYKTEYDGYYTYSSETLDNSKLYGKVTCKGENCNFIRAFDKYVLIEEDEEYYIYNYDNNSLEFGPFNSDKENYYKNLLFSDNTLYGIYYTEDSVNNIYNLNTGKVLKNIKGNLLEDIMTFSPSIMYKYNLVVLENNEIYNFVNLRTGNISYTIKDKIGRFIEDENNKIVYMLVYNSNYDKFKIYNSNGKLLFNGKEFKNISLSKGNLVVSTETEYKVYDSSLNLKLSSKTYDEVLALYEDFIVVLDDNHLEILDLDDKILATFKDEWDSSKYKFHSMISGWYTENGKHGIYLVVENEDIPYGTLGSGMEYYYIPDTNEVGVIETSGVGGYAKPVLYLYPKEKTNVTVTFEHPNLLTTTYPKFIDKWEVIANPNGDLYDSRGNYYYALYWEENKNHYIDFSEGFYVTKDNAIEFLEEKLSIIGLNAKERNEFIMYWLPILEKNEKSLVYFELTKERDTYNKLIINPKPDSVLRVAIHVKKVNKKTSIKEQNLTSFERNGFTAVEWGGVIY